MSVLVSRPRPSGGCRICDLPPDQRHEINAAIWDGAKRHGNYRAAGARVFEQLTGDTLDVKTVARHAEHTEASWREATLDDPASGREETVFATDYESLTERAALIGVHAMTELEQRVIRGALEDRELLGVAKMGLTARQQQKQLEMDKARPEIGLMAIISIASGHADVPEAESVEVIDPADLKARVQQERRRLEARAGGE